MKAVDLLKEEIKNFLRKIKGKSTKITWKSAHKLNRFYFDKDYDGKKAFTELVSVMETTIETLKEIMKVLNGPNISVSSALDINSISPEGNAYKRNSIAINIRALTGKIEKVRASIYDYVFNIN